MIIAPQDTVEEAIDKSSNGIMVLSKSIQWKHAFFSSTSVKANYILYVILPSSVGNYYIIAVPKSLHSEKCRKPFPITWAGLKGIKFQVITRMSTAIFCDSKRSICCARGLEDAILIAMQAVEK